MIQAINESTTDFKLILTSCIMCFDSEYETAENRASDWLWLTRNNHKIGEIEDDDTPTIEDEIVFTDTLNQISEFTDIIDKKCMCYYLITINSNEDNIKISLNEKLPQEELNLQNKEVNEFIAKIRYVWNQYDEAILENQNKKLELVIGKDTVDNLNTVAKGALSNIQVGALNKQLYKLGFNNLPDWDSKRELIANIKSEYRDNIQDKEKIIWNKFMKDELPYEDYMNKVLKLKNSISSNLEDLGGVNDATAE